jgi:hypothetical protein
MSTSRSPTFGGFVSGAGVTISCRGSRSLSSSESPSAISDRSSVARPRLLDLYSGAGGAAAGYARAGWDVTGVDLRPQPRYPYAFILGDALEVAEAIGRDFDAIHASPPCQSYSSHVRSADGFYSGGTRGAKRYARARGLPWDSRAFSVTGKGRRAGTSALWAELLGVDWPMSQHELREAIPPAYTEHIGRELVLRG